MPPANGGMADWKADSQVLRNELVYWIRRVRWRDPQEQVDRSRPSALSTAGVGCSRRDRYEGGLRAEDQLCRDINCLWKCKLRRWRVDYHKTRS